MNIPEISSYYPPFANQTKPQFNNPITTTPPIASPYLPKTEVQYVNGMEEATAFQMAPNSSTLLLDKNLNVLWVVATDQNGSKSVVKGYNIGEEYTPPKPVTLDDLMAQMQSMNERLNKMEEGTRNAKSYSGSSGQSKPNGSGTDASIRNGAGDAVRKPNGDADGAK